MGVSMILLAAGVVGILGLLIGVFLGVAAEKFEVQTDERADQIRELLPGNNCGGCGYPGCDGLAAAIASGEAPVDSCPVGGAPVAEQIAAVMGVKAESKKRMVAFVRCSGTCNVIHRKYNYYGVPDCRNVTIVPGSGEKSCKYGCMGYGSCVTACDFSAIRVINGVAVVDKEKCRGCEKCVKTCPNQLIEMVPYDAVMAVRCNSKDIGKDVRANCSGGCIGCTMCTVVCETGAITVTDHLAHIDYEKCTGCGKCAQKCPVKVITMR